MTSEHSTRFFGLDGEPGEIATLKTPEERFLAVKRRKSVPHEFVVDALAEAQPRTSPMFGCLAVYVGEKIVLILRDKKAEGRGKTNKPEVRRKRGGRKLAGVPTTRDNGVWLATTMEHHESLRQQFPNMRSIAVLGKKVTGWQLLPADAPDFEASALRACELVLAGDERIGKMPKKKKRDS